MCDAVKIECEFLTEALPVALIGMNCGLMVLKFLSLAILVFKTFKLVECAFYIMTSFAKDPHIHLEEC